MTSRSNMDPGDQASMMTTDACHEIEQDAVPSPAPEGLKRGNRSAVPLLAPLSPNTDTVDLDGENMVPIEDSNSDTRRDPLLGTIYSSGEIRKDR